MTREQQESRRRNIVALYTKDLLSLKEIAQKIGSNKESVRYVLNKANVKIRPAHRPRMTERQARSTQAEYSKFAGAWTCPPEASLQSTMARDERIKLYAGREYDDHPNPRAGIPVRINPRGVRGFQGSNVGCAAAMCAERGSRTIGHWN